MTIELPSPAAPAGALAAPTCFAAKGHCIRRLQGEDDSILTAHFKRLDADTRRLRFGNAVNDHFLASYAQLSLGEDTIAKGLFVDGVLRGVGEIRVLSADRGEAEAAFSIESDFQGLGHGKALFESLLGAARNRGVRRLFLTCLRENVRMQKIAARFGAELSFVSSGVAAEIGRPHPDAGTLGREIAEDGGFAFALLDWRETRPAALLGRMRRVAVAFNPFPARP